MPASARATALWGAIAAAKGRYALSLIAIALGVSLGYAVHLINSEAVNEFTLGLRSLTGNADLIVRGPQSGFDEALYARLARRAEVADASPIVEVDVRVRGLNDSVKLLGIDVFRAAHVEPGLIGQPTRNGTDESDGAGRAAFDGLANLQPGNVFISPALEALLAKSPKGLGDSIIFQIGLDERLFKIAGRLSSDAARGPLAVMDIGAAQEIFVRGDRLHRVDLRLFLGVDREALVRRLISDLPPGVRIERPADTAAGNARLSRAYRVNLNVLALVALFTGGLLVFSTQSLGIVRRRQELALLRVLGVTRRALMTRLLAESALLGAVGASLGLAIGYLIAASVSRYVGADLGAGFFRGVTASVGAEPLAASIFFLLGVAVAVAGTFAPALEAARAAPAQALKAGDEQRALARLVHWEPGTGLILAGALATLAPPIAELPIPGYLAIALILMGTISLIPWLGVRLIALIGRARLVRDFHFRPRLLAARLAVLQLQGAPGQATVSLAAIVASVSLIVSMAIMVTSFRTSLGDWLERLLPADLYLRSGGAGDTAYFDANEQARIAKLPGVQRAEFLRVERIVLGNLRARVQLLARDLDRDDPGKRLPLVGASADPSSDIPVWINEQVQGLYGYRVGERIELPIAGRRVPVTVAGVWRDYGRPQGAIVIERGVYASLTGDRNANDAALWFDSPAAINGVREALSAYEGRVEFLTPGEIREVSLSVFDRTFAVTYGLEAAAVIIGLAGLSASFGALVLARRREFGVLRHIGMTRRQIAGMLATEGLLVSALGIAAGWVSGWVISLILVYVVNRQSFHWSMDLHVPWAVLTAFVLGLLVLATATAIASGRRALSIDAVRAVKEDW